MTNKTLRLLGNSALSSAVCTLLMTLGPGCDTDKLFKPEEATLDDVRNLVQKDIISCREMVGNYQQLHDSLDPAVSGIASWNDRLAADADRLDQIPPDQRGDFHCFPIIVKDNMDYAGLPTTGGAKALGGARAGSNAEVVKRLLDAGAIVLGKSNMPDFATDGTNTLSSFAGQTVNPYARARTVYGSSGGTAAAISVSLGIIGLGSDTYGSLVQPSSA